jgi:hypothetical protein
MLLLPVADESNGIASLRACAMSKRSASDSPIITYIMPVLGMAGIIEIDMERIVKNSLGFGRQRRGMNDHGPGGAHLTSTTIIIA